MSNRYPRKIQQQRDAIKAREDELRNPQPDPPPAPAADPILDPPPADEVVQDPPPADPPPAADPNNTPEYWRARFHTVEGVLRKEREERTRDQQAQATQLQTLQTQVQQLQQQATAGRDPVAEVDLSQHFTPEVIEQHGAEHLRSVLRAAQRTLQPQLQQAVDAALAPVRQQLEQTQQNIKQERQSQANTAYDSFLTKVSELVPTWQQVNQDPRFHAYLEAVDEATGMRRQDLLGGFEQRRDATRVAKVFSDFLKTVAPPVQRDPQRRAVPAGQSGGGNEPPPPGPTITQAEIRQFQADIAKGRYRGRAAEQKAMQDRIDQAYLGNRIG